MLRLLRLTLLICCVCAISIFVAQRIGATQPGNPLLAILFSNPDGSPCEQPCMFGVRPGKTTQSEAITILKAHPMTSGLELGDEGVVFTLNGPNFSVQVVLDYVVLDAIQAINIEFNHNASTPIYLPEKRILSTKITLGEIINYFGLPDKAYTMWGASLSHVSKDYTFYTAYNMPNLNDHISPNELLNSIGVSPVADASSEAWNSWRGFTRVDYYQ